MSLTWITVTSKLQQGIQLLNTISTTEFSALLQRILNKTEFTSLELNNLETTLELQPNNVELLLQTVVHILKQSSKVILKPTTLQKQLVENLHFESNKAEEFVKAWTSQTKQDFENLEDRLKLNTISWELNLEMCSSLEPKKVTPNVRLKFSLNDSKDAHFKNVVLEMEKKELQQLYNTFENIQNKLDILQKSTE
ncbi:hypothetical protein RN001_006855 [Aquatica leii]|uniref:COMM domain-containing protein n=1 Tax=Aquatica leii TaxID=1421715 RepID=A0AAN7PLK0_9COLE|nr:hypothetical protein RN001_006855 [Aquatica leii]